MKKSTLENPLGTLGENTFNFNPQQWASDQERIDNEREKYKQEIEMKNFTGKPNINKASQKIKREIKDLYDWQTKQVKKVEN
jgi:hypothetical protein